MGWLQLVGSTKLKVSFAKEPYKRDDILQKRPVILSILVTVATPYLYLAPMHKSKVILIFGNTNITFSFDIQISIAHSQAS